MNGALPDTLAKIVSKLGVMTPKAYEMMQHKLFIQARAEAWVGGVFTCLFGGLALYCLGREIFREQNSYSDGWGMPAVVLGILAIPALLVWVSGMVGMQTVDADAIMALIRGVK